MAIYEFVQDNIRQLNTTTFDRAGVRERRDLQRLLRDRIEVISPDTLVISEEFGEWEDSKRRIDLLGIDKNANLVVIELKRTEDGGHMDLQAIRYAAMVSTMTFDQAAEVFGQYRKALGEEDDPREALLEFLEWEDPDEDTFAQDVRIVLASGEFSREVTSSVLWLLDHDIDIRCVRLQAYELDGRLLVDVQQVIPLPEATEYQVKVREKTRKERAARQSVADFTRYDLVFEDQRYPGQWKRNALYLVCRHLLERGVKPEELAEVLPWRTLWYTIDGNLDAAEFTAAAARRAQAGGPVLSSGKWFSADGELFHIESKTYALAKSWGKRWREAMDLLKNKYTQFRIEFTPEQDGE